MRTISIAATDEFDELNGINDVRVFENGLNLIDPLTGKILYRITMLANASLQVTTGDVLHYEGTGILTKALTLKPLDPQSVILERVKK